MPVERPTFSESWYRVVDLHPALRSSVQVYRQHYRGQMWHVLQDPGTNQFFRLNNSAYQFIAMLDGRRSVGEVWKACNDRLEDNAPTQGEVIQLLGQLYASNLLQADLPPDAEGLLRRHHKRRTREVQGYLMNLLFIRIPLFDPDAFLNRWVGILGQAFTKPALILWVALVGTGLYFVGGRVGELADRASGILDSDNLVLLYLSFTFVKIFHEFGHAFACKKFGLSSGGGEVHTMGIMFLVFTPMPYVDASSAWALRSKWQRIVVGTGGMFVELAIAAVAAIVWANTTTGTTHAICYNIMFIASVSTLLFNGNPLLRYDGYYILSDLLEIPNLAQRSRQHIYYLVKKYIWGVRGAHSPAHSSGERFWFPIYGIASTIYRVFICTAILLFIADKFFLLGTILAVVAVVTWGLVPLGKFIRYLFTNRELSRVRPRALLTTGLFFTVLFIAIGAIKAPRHSRAEGIVEPVHMAIVYATEDGFVQSVLPTGRRVRKDGEPLLECENRELSTRHEQLLAERRRLEVQHRVAMTREEAAVQIYAQRIETLDGQIRHLKNRLDALIIRPSLDGTWIAPDAERYKGVYLQRGKPVGVVADLSEVRIRATATQRIAGTIIHEADWDNVEIRIKGRADLHLRGRIVNILSAGTKELRSQALGIQVGGTIRTEPDDSKGTKAAERLFEIVVAPEGDAKKNIRLLDGQRVMVRFTMPSQPLLTQWWHSILQLVQRRFNI